MDKYLKQNLHCLVSYFVLIFIYEFKQLFEDTFPNELKILKII